MKNITKKELQQFFQQEKEFEFGTEKEVLLIAKDKNGNVFNFLENKKLVNQLKKQNEIKKYLSSGWKIVPEYSKCLIEIISPVYKSHEIKQWKKDLKQILLTLETVVKNSKLLNNFKIEVSDQGTSKVNKYIDSSGEIKTNKNLQDLQSIVLPNYKDLVYNNKNLRVKFENYTYNKAIEVYNHLNSFHITFHPTYKYKKLAQNLNSYLQFLNKTSKIIQKYKQYDKGNNEIIRNNKKYKLSKNLRDIFLREYMKKNSKLNNKFQNETYHISEDLFLQKINGIKNKFNIKDPKNLDKGFNSWPSLDFRPRLLKQEMFLIEIRAFGSNMKLDTIEEIIKKLINIDRNHE